MFNIRLSVAKNRKSEPWSKPQLIKVLKSLKSGKSCDALGYSNELFKPGVIGNDLIESLLNIVNRAKHELSIPRPFRLTKITSIYKNKGEKCDLNSDRGVHSVTKFRSIIDKLLYNDKYKEIDRNMSDCNVGGRRNRSIRDNLFVIHAAINDAIGYQKVEIDIGFYDLSQCFDSMWHEETMNDLWESMEVKDDKFSLISEMNREVDLFVKTPVGDSEIFTVERIEQQGTVLAPLKCSNQMDSIARECLADTNMEMFKYRGAVSIPPLGMIDDLASVSYCGPDSVIMNAVINAKVGMKRLEFNKSKCVKLHVSNAEKKTCSNTGPRTRDAKCVFLEVQDSEMRDAESERYVGDVISNTGSNDANISRRKSIGIGALSTIFAILNEVSLGYQYIEIGLILRETMLLSKILLSVESWHKVFLYQTEKLEEVDRMFYKQLFNAHSKTGIEFYYSESATIPIRIKMSARRLLYWWHILSVDNSELIFRVYSAQKMTPIPGDWILQLEKDKEQFNLNLSDQELISISQEKFKNYVKKRSIQLTSEYLEKLQKKNSKSKQLDMRDMRISPYLQDSRFSKCERELLFKLRSKTVWVKGNFPNAYLENNMLCELCKLFPCIQSHPLQCPKLTSSLIVEKKLHISETFIYGNVDQQLLYVKIYKQYWDLREKRIKEQSED